MLKSEGQSGSPTPADDAEARSLRLISEGTAHAVGEAFFQSLVRHLSLAMNVAYAFVAEFTREHTVKTLAYWKRDQIGDNVEFDVRGTPCEDVVAGRLCHY